MEEKALIIKTGSAKQTLFHAEHPESLTHYLQQEEERVTRQQEQLRGLLPEMISAYTLAENKPGVFRFEGKNGMITAYEELLKDKLNINSIQNRTQLRKFIPEYNPQFVATRVKNRIFHRIISPAPLSEFGTDDIADMREVRYIDNTRFPFNMDLKITNKKVLMTTFKKETAAGMIIVDPEVVRNYKILFEFLWNDVAKK
ncbi:MAG: hypothetical protein HYV32_03930 [Candidatus Kerfeldbacteria bacterium]|nr:hypothetical protein [Candidatus Kerfeldbacteria bacterium]